MNLIIKVTVLSLIAQWCTLAHAQSPVEMSNLLQRLKGINQPEQCTLNDDLKYVCDSMTTLSCKPGTFDDGTGVALSDEDYEAKIQPLKKKATTTYRKNILGMLENSDPAYELVRNLALKATLQKDTPECLSSEKSEKKKCYERVASLLTDKSVNQMFSIKPLREMGIASGEPIDRRMDFDAYSTLMDNTLYKESLQKSYQKTLEEVSDDRLSKKIETKIFPRVKELLIAKIKKSVSDLKTQESLINKIQNISYAGNDCSSLIGGSSDDGSVNGLMVENAYYSSKKQEFRFCNGYLLNNTSEFMIVKVIAHELSHSIDPGHVDQPKGVGFAYQQDETSKIEDLEKQFPFKDVVGCLRSKESIGARTINTYRPQLKVNPFAKKDQIGESFSDWMAAELLPEYMGKYHPKLTQNQLVTGYSNAFRTYCKTTRRESFDVHPNVMDRIDRLMMANTDIRKQVGCGESKSIHHCKVGDGFVGTPPDPLPVATPSQNPINDQHEGHNHD